MNLNVPQSYTTYAKEHRHGVTSRPHGDEKVKGCFHYLRPSLIDRLTHASKRKNRSRSQLISLFIEQGLEHDENVVRPLEQEALRRMSQRDEPLAFYQT